MRILAINPGSTSTKIAVHEDGRPVWATGAHHPVKELSAFQNINDQYAYRKDFIIKRLTDGGQPLLFDAVIGRGGLLKPLPGGVYRVNKQMKKDLVNATMEHACNLGALLADDMARSCQCPAFIADPVVVDELQPVARYSGIPEIPRRSVFHALNSKAVARQFAAQEGKSYESMNLIVAHLGGGISVGAHRHGRVIDVNNALNGEGPFSPERAGTVPAGQFAELCFSGNHTLKEVKQMLHGKGGLTAYLGTNDMITIAAHAEQGDEPWKSVLDAMLYTIAKQIGAMFVTLEGKADAILLTGGLAHSTYCTEGVTRQVGFLAPVSVFPGEGEMDSLLYDAKAALTGELEIKEYA